MESSRLGARMCLDLAGGTLNCPPCDIPAHWPRPLRELALNYPELVVTSVAENDLKTRLERLARSSDTADERAVR